MVSELSKITDTVISGTEPSSTGRQVLFPPHNAAYSTWEEEQIFILNYTTSLINIISIHTANSQGNVI